MEVALANELPPILVTLAGMEIEVSEVAPENAPFTMLVTPAGITIAPAQLPPDETTPSVIV